MTRDELRMHGYYLRWQKKNRRNCFVALFLHDVRIVQFTGRSEPKLRQEVYEYACVHFVSHRLAA